MGELVRTGAQVKCTFGDAPAAFKASGAKVSATAPVGVVTDVGLGNIPTFGMCTSAANPAVAAEQGAPAPCVPSLTPWAPGTVGVTINSVTALDSASQCECEWAGVITVLSPGQERVTTR
jgi:hypothetical protein